MGELRRSRLTGLAHRIERMLSTARTDDHLMTTADGADWAEASLSRGQLEKELGKGSVHRRYDEP